MKTTSKAIAFVRVANNLDNKESANVRHQKELIQKTAKRFGLEIVEWFDQNVGTARASQDITLSRAIKYCESSPEIKYLIVSSADRISRDYLDYQNWAEVIKKTGLRLVTSQTKILGQETPVELFQRDLEIAMSSYISRTQVESVMRGIRNKKVAKG